jgi:hypothetical protein
VRPGRQRVEVPDMVTDSVERRDGELTHTAVVSRGRPPTRVLALLERSIVWRTENASSRKSHRNVTTPRCSRISMHERPHFR